MEIVGDAYVAPT